MSEAFGLLEDLGTISAPTALAMSAQGSALGTRGEQTQP